MDVLDKARSLKGDELSAFARELFDGGENVKPVLTGLVLGGSANDYDTLAEMIGCFVVAESSSYGTGRNYYEAKSMSECDRRLDFFVSKCRECGLAEDEYIRVLLAARYSKGALSAWKDAVDKHLKILAATDYGRVADHIDKYDKKFANYSSLLAVAPHESAKRLVEKLLYEKNIDKAAIRAVLMDYVYIANELVALYEVSDAKTRAAIAKLLTVYKNDARVRDFLTGTVSVDRSKTVRDVLEPKARHTKSALKFFEGHMISGKPIPVKKFFELTADGEWANVADLIFFCTKSNEGITVMTFDDGAFYGIDDEPIALEADKLYVLHPIEMPAYAEEILSYCIEQPFLQVNRPVYRKPSDERKFSDKLSGTMLDKPRFLQNLKSVGFELAAKRGSERLDVALYFAGDYAVGVGCELPAASDTAVCRRVSFYRSRDIVRIKRDLFVGDCAPVMIRELPAAAYSELVYAVFRLFDCT